MSLTYYWEPFVSDIERALEDTFGRHGRPSTSTRGHENQAASTLRPRIDVHESTDSNLITATVELPGLKKDDIHIDIHNNRLTVSGEVAQSNDLNQDGYKVKERRYGKFARTLSLPVGTKAEDVKAALNDGVLTVTFPKTSAEQEARRVTIN